MVTGYSLELVSPPDRDLEHVAAFLNGEDAPALRAALRALVAGERPAVAVRATLAVGPDGEVVADSEEARVLLAVRAAQARGTWSRLKLCAGDDCGTVFVDTSRNRSAVWCSMARCGNRAKVRAYRGRARSAA